LKRTTHRSALPREKAEAIALKHSFDDLFERVETIELKTDSAHTIADVNSVRFFPNGDFAVADNAARQLLLFKHSGDLIKKVGGSGKGPGEYARISDLATNARGELLVLDNSLMRVTKFDSTGRYLESYTVVYGSILHPTLDGGFYIYDVVSASSREGSLIHKYDKKGREEKSFCSAPSGLRVNRIPIAGGGLASNPDGELFVVHASEYKIRKFTERGDSIGAFGREAPFYTPLEPPVSLSDTAKLNSFTPVSGIFALPPGVIVVLVQRTKPLTRWLEIYDFDGNFLTGSIEMPKGLVAIKAVHNDALYFKESFPFQLNAQRELPNVRLLGYRLRI